MRLSEAGPPQEQIGIDAEFAAIWESNHLSPYPNPVVIAGENALTDMRYQTDPRVSTIHLTDVTLRDGQQQRTKEVTTRERVEVFDEIVRTGIDRIEIGHLGNSNGDQQLAGEIIRHVAEMEQHDDRFAQVKLQVLFGSQENLIRDGIDVLRHAFQRHYGDDWEKVMADKVIVHVYDRVDQNLINTASDPYDPQESARRVVVASQYALDAGFKHFSVTGEAATAVTPENAIQYYRSVNRYLTDHGAETISSNLANTYGYSANTEWNTATLAIFNAAVKHDFDNVTTSIHTHNDADNAVSFAMGAVVAGFDRVEGTINGMGERAGNVATIDVVARVLEAARHQIEEEERLSGIAHLAAAFALRRKVRLDPNIIENLGTWYGAARRVSERFGTHALYRWHRTSVGNPYAHDNGSGPHDRAMKAAIENPVGNPPYLNYEWFVAPTDILGRPGSAELAIGDPEAIRAVTVGNHAGGGSTATILQGGIKRADPEVVAVAATWYQDYRNRIIGKAATRTIIVAA